MNDVKFKPLFDRLLVERTKDVDKVGDIVIPESAQEKSRKGTVLAVGPGRRNDEGEIIPLDVKVGDVVVFGYGIGMDVYINGEEYLIIPEVDALAKITEDE